MRAFIDFPFGMPLPWKAGANFFKISYDGNFPYVCSCLSPFSNSLSIRVPAFILFKYALLLSVNRVFFIFNLSTICLHLATPHCVDNIFKFMYANIF